ncbi:MAG: aminotransferase class I/II-fold pyridoxal phosphate-dependent enzyme, partial [Clostridiales Family XIII bacterium]|nr:aminotransferase class I/II-fold pyridoxal phosphate-dependent enzyme [Clostridiales Family XIII bacterium]
MMREIPLSKPNLGADIVENLRECVETGWVSTGGRFISEFEAAVAACAGVEDAVACQSGTAGLHTALRILGVGAGDAVIAPTLTFIAAVNPVRYLGAEPIFMDCDEHFCMDAAKLEDFCANECRRDARGRLFDRVTGRRVAAVVVVHVFGDLADMEGILRVARAYGLKVLEDATEAIGSRYAAGRYKGRYAGTVGDMGVYSFNANKIITTGGGGMILAGGRGAASRARLARARYLTTTAKDDGLRFIHGDVGYNYRMLNLQAALGVSQIKELERFIAIKTENLARYAERLAGAEGLRLLPFRADIRANHWFYALEVEEAAFGMSRDALLAALNARGVQCRPVWRLCHRQKPYKKARRHRIRLAPRYEKTVLNLPCSTDLRPE